MNRKILNESLKYFFITCIVVFPPIFLGNHFYEKLFFNQAYHVSAPAEWLSYSLTHLVIVAFPEEFFFRGYMQSAFTAAFPAKRKIYGVPMGKGIILLSLIFAISHSLIAMQWWHIFIFFPALVFSWLREKTGTIWASTLFHAVSNLFGYWAALHY